MTNEEFTQELLIEAESLGIRKEVLELSNKIKQENEFMDINSSIERAFQRIKIKLQEYNKV
jgi:tRNA G26 N,N-dimethylase Trm1